MMQLTDPVFRVTLDRVKESVKTYVISNIGKYTLQDRMSTRDMASDIGESVDNTKHALDHLFEDGTLPGILINLISGTHPRRVDIEEDNIKIEDLSTKSNVETLEIPAGMPLVLDKEIDMESRDKIIEKKRIPWTSLQKVLLLQQQAQPQREALQPDFTPISNMRYYVPPSPSDLVPKPISKRIDISPDGMKTVTLVYTY